MKGGGIHSGAPWLAIEDVNAGNPMPHQFVAATASIRSPEEHMRKLSRQKFTVVDKEHHRAPRHHSQPLYLPLQIEQGTAGEQLVALVSESSRRTQRPM